MQENINDIPRTNREFLGYIDKKTEHIYMISEFIDNSVQSMLDYNKDSIRVNVIVNMKEKAIYIIDNAAGIPYENRKVAIKNGKDETEQGSSLNMFGVGMKMASIWLGKRLRIYTKHINDDFAYSIKLDVEELKGDNFYFTDSKIEDLSKESNINFEYTSGTIIKIDKLHLNSVHKGRYDSRMFKRGLKSSGKSLEEQIACRYSRFIRKGKLNINLSYINEEGKEEMTIDNKSVDITQSMIPNIFISSINGNDYEYIDGKNINITNYYKTNLNKLKLEYKDKMEDSTGFIGLKYIDIFEKFENQEEFKFNCQIQLNDKKYNKFKVPFMFGFIGKSKDKKDNYLKYNGLSVFQDNRAIISGPNSSQTNLTWLTFDKSLSGNSHYVNNRFCGEIELDDKSIFRVDNNKIGFHGNVKEDIEKEISDIFKQNLSPIFKVLLEIIFYKDEQVKSDNEIKKEIERFSKVLNKNNTLEDTIITTNEITMIEPNTNDERPRNAFHIESKKDPNITYDLTYNMDLEFDNEKTIFKIDSEIINDTQLLVLYINKKFIGFKKNLKDEELLVLVNPIINLIVCTLNDCKTDEQRLKKIINIVQMFHNG